MDVLRLNNKFFYIFINFNLNNYLPKVAIYNIYKIQNTQYSNYNLQKNKNPILNLNSLNFNKFINELNFNITKKKQFIDNINNHLNCCVVLNKKDIIHENWFSLSLISNKNFETWCDFINWKLESTCGNARTIEIFKSKGFYSASLSKIFKFLISKGKTNTYLSVKKNNKIGNLSLKKFNPSIIGIGYKINFLFIKIYFLKKII